MKLLIETGNEEHSSSYARLQAKYHGGPNNGKHLYEVKSAQISAEWDTDKHHRWTKTVYELPEETEIEIIGKSYGDDMQRIYRLDTSAEVFEEYLCHIQGHNRGIFKGRLVLVRDLLEEKAKRIAASQNEGF